MNRVLCQALKDEGDCVPDWYWDELQKKMETFEVVKEPDVDIDVDFLKQMG